MNRQPKNQTGRLHPQSFGFTGICPCGGRVKCKLTGNKPKRVSLSTCVACMRVEIAREDD